MRVTNITVILIVFDFANDELNHVFISYDKTKSLVIKSNFF